MDISKIKSRLTQLQSTTSTKDNFWKPQPGKTQIRIVPSTFNKENPFVEAPITESKDVLEKIFNSQIKLEDLWDEPSYDDLKDALHRYLNPSEEESDSSSTTSETNTKSQPKVEAKSTEKVEDAFDQLFNS